MLEFLKKAPQKKSYVDIKMISIASPLWQKDDDFITRTHPTWGYWPILQAIGPSKLRS
jgi:hypothetical protein